MMKKSVIAVSLALAVGISNMAFAGFGIPGVSKAPKADSAAQSSSETQTAAVDLSDITGKQQKVLKYMCGALYAQAQALIKVKEADGTVDKELLEATAALKNPSNSNAKKAEAVIKKASAEALTLASKADKANLDKAKLAAALKSGKVYMQASYVNYGVVTATLPGALSEASSASKNLTKDPVALNKVNGAISTYKLAGSIAGESKKIIDDYDAMVASWKGDGFITDADLDAAPAADVETIANDCLNYVGEK